MEKRRLTLLIGCAASTFFLMPSCVNDDYDLNKDIDMTINVGGDLTIPTSATSDLTIKELFELEDDGIVQLKEVNPATKDSAYYLIKGADEPSSFSFNIDAITVEDPEVETFSMGFKVPELEILMKKALGENYSKVEAALSLEGKTFADFKNNPSLQEKYFTAAQRAETYTSDPFRIDEGFDAFDFEFEIPEEVVAIDSVYFLKKEKEKKLMKADVYLKTDLEVGELGLQRVEVRFPGELHHSLNHRPDGSWEGTLGGYWFGHITEEGGDRFHRFLLPDVFLSEENPEDHLAMEFDAMEMKYDKHTAETPGTLKMESRVSILGWVSIRGTLSDFITLAGNPYKLEVTDIKITAPTISVVEAVVDPEIDEETTSIELDDVPDFLTEEGGRFILKEPRMNLSVISDVVVDVNCWGTLTAMKEGSAINGTPLQVGEENTGKLQLAGNTESNWSLYDGKYEDFDFTGYKPLKIDGLKNVIETMPENIDMAFKARVNQEFYKIELGREYTVTVDYAVESPLALGERSQIVYSDTIEDMSGDLEDLEVKTLKLSATLKLNEQLPFNKIDLELVPIDINKEEIQGIKITPIKGIGNDQPINLTITCESGAMQELDGLILKATAIVDKADAEPLRPNNAVRLVDIKVGIEGGVIMDMN